MNLEVWKERERELKKQEPKCTCDGGRKHPDKTYHYADCPYLQFWNHHFNKFCEKPVQQTLAGFTEEVET